MVKFFLFLVLIVQTSACATAPGTYNFDKSRSYALSYENLWEDLVAFFAKHNIPIKNIAKDSGLIYAESSSFSDDSADCGDRGLYSLVNRTLNLNVFVSRSGAQPLVSVNSKFYETRRFDRTITTVECNSKGTIEEAILNSVRR